MGLNTRSGGGNGKVFLKLANGKVTREWNEEPKDEWIPLGKEVLTRLVTKGKNAGAKRWYIEYDDVSGKLIDVDLKEMEGGINVIELYLQDGLETFILSIPEESAYGNDFLLKMRNIDVSGEVSFSPWTMSPEEWLKLTGKKRQTDKVGLSIYNGTVDKENAVTKYYTQEEPNGLPDLVQKTIKGKVTYDSDDRTNFLYEELKSWIEDVKKALNGPSSTKPSKEEGTVQSKRQSKPTDKVASGKGRATKKVVAEVEDDDDEPDFDVDDLPF